MGDGTIVTVGVITTVGVGVNVGVIVVVGAAAHETNKSITDIASKKEALRKYENKADLISTALYKNCFYDYRITYGLKLVKFFCFAGRCNATNFACFF